MSACRTAPRRSASSRRLLLSSLTCSSLWTCLTPYTRLAALVASRLSRRLPTVPRRVTTPSSVETAIAWLSTLGSQKSSSSTLVRNSSLDTLEFPSCCRVPCSDRRCAEPGDLERQPACGIDPSDAERQDGAVIGR